MWRLLHKHDIEFVLDCSDLVNMCCKNAAVVAVEALMLHQHSVWYFDMLLRWIVLVVVYQEAKASRPDGLQESQVIWQDIK